MSLIKSTPFLPAEVISLPTESHNHAHDHHQLVIATSGHSEFSIEGLQSLIIPGQGCVVTTSSEHAFNGLGNSEILTLNLPSEDAFDVYTNECFNSIFTQNQFFKLDVQFQNLLTLLVKEIRVLPADPLVAEACKNTIIALLKRHMYTDLPTKMLKRVRINMDIIDAYIHKHIASKITISQLAGCVFLGESQFHSLFKQQMSITPHQYILKLRFNFAKAQLENNALTLSEIATRSGFANQSSFTHAFTKLQGISPSKYRS
ncbi:AraC family transcriptional regulator [Psychromonas aquatilis]|uniref:AraC family transcriptional regulator n=1 Tax=Psychromonas aquatilis TaxID=2005072 RepID=A0ABU9GMN7_9GAMM